MITTEVEHSTYMGHRSIRDAKGRNGVLFFARCRCEWDGPSRLNRSVAVQDGLDHLAEVAAKEES